VLFDLDISDWAAGRSEVQIRWEIASDDGAEFGGWNIDDVCLMTADGTPEPPFAEAIALEASSGNGCGCRAAGRTPDRLPLVLGVFASVFGAF
jgi:hypothetical protein